MAVPRRAGRDVRARSAAGRLPDAGRTAHDRRLRPRSATYRASLYLHGSRTLAVRAPLDGCGAPLAAAWRAFDALGAVDLAATKLDRVTSPLAQTSGCSDQYKDMLAVEEESGGPRQIVDGPESPWPRAPNSASTP